MILIGPISNLDSKKSNILKHIYRRLALKWEYYGN